MTLLFGSGFIFIPKNGPQRFSLCWRQLSAFLAIVKLEPNGRELATWRVTGLVGLSHLPTGPTFFSQSPVLFFCGPTFFSLNPPLFFCGPTFFSLNPPPIFLWLDIFPRHFLFPPSPLIFQIQTTGTQKFF